MRRKQEASGGWAVTWGVGEREGFWLAGWGQCLAGGAPAGIGTTQGGTGDRAGRTRKGGEWGKKVCMCVYVLIPGEAN